MEASTESNPPVREVGTPDAHSSSQPDQPATADEVVRVLNPAGHVEPGADPKLDLQLVKRMYVAMVRARLLDERLTKLQRQGRIGFHVGAEGEEAAIVATAAAMRPQDWLFPCYREIAAAMWRGLPLQTYIDNMFGNANDVPKGRQMPDHVTGRDAHYVSVTAPIGTQITQAVGFGWAAKLQGQDTVTGAYFGDGATSCNDFHAAMTFAGVYRAPTVFLLRNNGWAISVPAAQQTAAERLSDKAVGYGMPAVRVDGNDALAIYKVTDEAVRRAARGEGPTLIELLTYRAGAHTTSDDPSVYREAAEVEQQQGRDPIARLRAHLEHLGAWNEADQQATEAALLDELKGCIERAEQAPAPSIESMFEDVYEHMPKHLEEQQAECVSGPRARKRH